MRLAFSFVLIESDSRLMHFLNGSRTLPKTKNEARLLRLSNKLALGQRSDIAVRPCMAAPSADVVGCSALFGFSGRRQRCDPASAGQFLQLATNITPFVLCAGSLPAFVAARTLNFACLRQFATHMPFVSLAKLAA